MVLWTSAVVLTSIMLGVLNKGNFRTRKTLKPWHSNTNIMKLTIGRVKGRSQIKIFNGLNYISAQMFWDFVNFLAVLDKTGKWNRLILRSLRTRASMANNSVCSLLSTLRCIYMLSWRVDLVPLKTINTSSQAIYELLRRNESLSLRGVFQATPVWQKVFLSV